MTKLLKANRTWSCACPPAYRRFSPNLKVSSWVPSSILRAWGSHFWVTPCDGPFLSSISTECSVSFEKCTLRCGPKNFVLVRKNRLGFLTCFEFFSKATEPFFCCLSVSVCIDTHLLPHTHSQFYLWYWHSRGCKNTWRIPTEGLLPLGTFRFEGVLPSFLSGLGAGEDGCDFFPRLLSWQKLQVSPFEHCPFAFHWKHSPCFPSTLTCFPLRVFSNTLVSILSFQTLKFRFLIIWSVCLFTMVTSDSWRNTLWDVLAGLDSAKFWEVAGTQSALLRASWFWHCKTIFMRR